MQGIGNLTVPLVALILVGICGNPPSLQDGGPSNIGLSWRLALGLGALPGILLAPFKASETKKDTVHKEAARTFLEPSSRRLPDPRCGIFTGGGVRRRRQRFGQADTHAVAGAGHATVLGQPARTFSRLASPSLTFSGLLSGTGASCSGRRADGCSSTSPFTATRSSRRDCNLEPPYPLRLPSDAFSGVRRQLAVPGDRPAKDL